MYYINQNKYFLNKKVNLVQMKSIKFTKVKKHNNKHIDNIIKVDNIRHETYFNQIPLCEITKYLDICDLYAFMNVNNYLYTNLKKVFKNEYSIMKQNNNIYSSIIVSIINKRLVICIMAKVYNILRISDGIIRRCDLY